MSFMLVIKTKAQIERIIVLHFPSCVCILQNKYFLIIKSSKQNLVRGSVNFEQVGWWVGWLVRKWSVVGCLVVSGSVASGFIKTHLKPTKISDNQLNTMQENPIDSLRKLKLSNPHKIILRHLNIDFLRNKFESIADVIQGTFDIYQKLKLTKSLLINSFA